MALNRETGTVDKNAKWRRRRLWIYVAIGLVAIAAFAGLSALDVVEFLYTYSHRSPLGPFTHFVNLFIVTTLALIAVLAVYSRDLKHEIARRQEAEGEVVQLASYDPLTGLPNRRNFLQTFDEQLKETGRSRQGVSLIVLDLDRFRAINDLYGHSGGDHVLQEIAQRLKRVVRPPHRIARLGADEFAILLVGVDDKQLVRTVRRLLKEVGRPITLAARPVSVTASVGIARAPRDGTHGEQLLQRADLSMGRAKSSGRNTYASFDSAIDSEARYRMSLEMDLPQALERNEIVPYFQPFVDLASGAVVGFEVLARWHHPRHGLVGSEAFIPVAEDAGMIGKVFAHILEEASLAAMEWHPPVIIAVNASPSQFGARAMVSTILDSLERTGLLPERLEIEITENAMVQDFSLALEIVGSLKELGISIALDDFGTGYSSLRHLHEIPIDKIKIDRSFVSQRRSGTVAATVVDLVIVLGHSLGLKVTAEGIEILEDALWLKERGCDLGQGYLFSEPVPASAVQALLDAGERPRGAII
ncbi:putative bifunctional diguanylate cyclase/phosphodiesterase [Amorphus sp. 3PC139-8]|uniref:putative bifunctional diguanylate cyclase/phosphodiesterase n=1 Tax=Amorphus sp. 3PC139-8 TaxID=2735676 RepID=UPI00345D6A7A